MNENGNKKREWIKTAAIIFLSVMLVLTFFSNTIQNWSLPEVATQYVQSGTITAKVQITGTIESVDPYSVYVKETRKVASVAVRTGDFVEEGAVLIYLEDTDGTELEEAKKELEAAQESYNKALLSDKVTVSDISTANQGVTAETLRSRITVAQNAVKAAEAAIDPKEAEVKRIQQLIDDFSQQVSYEQSMDSLAPQRVTAAKSDMDAAVQVRDAALAAKNSAQAERDKAQAAYNAYVSGGSVSSGNAGYEATKQQLLDNFNNAEHTYRKAVDRYNSAQERVNETTDYYNEAVRQKTERESSQTVVDLNNTIADLKIELYNATKDLTAAKDNLTKKQEDLAELLTSVGNVTGLESYLKAIETAQEKVDKLTEKSVGATITAPISGTVSSINVAAGDETTAAVPVAEIQREGQGFTLSHSVTNDQAKRLSVGDKADLINAWRYDDVTVTLASIKPDTKNPGQNKILTFDVTGSVMSGQTLSFSVGQKSANYDFIVPNSSIREDNNGKFILIVESKSSPLGTRYTASRVDVEVIASDETQSAVRGALQGYEFVITTSTKPVEAGKLVRLPND